MKKFLMLLAMFTCGEALAQQPALTSISPSFGSRGSTILATLRGSGFRETTTITTPGGGVLVLSRTLVSATEIAATLSLTGPPALYSVRVSDSGMMSNSVDFAVTPPALDGVSEMDVTDFAATEANYRSGVPEGAGFADGSGAAARFASPLGTWGDGTYLYVADSLNSVIRRVKITSGEVSTLAGMAGQPGSRDGIGSEARFWSPYGIWGYGGSLYITDPGNYTVRRLELETNIVTTVAGVPHEPGMTNGSNARFIGPTGIWGNANSLYIADSLTSGARSIRRIALDNRTVSTVADIGPAEVFPRFGVGLWGDDTHLYLADSSRHTVRRIVISSGIVTTIAGVDFEAGSADGQGVEVRFNSPSAIWGVGPVVYVADTDNFRIRIVFREFGRVSSITAGGGWPGSEDGLLNVARFGLPVGLWSVGTKLYISEINNHAIRVLDSSTNSVSTLAGRPAALGSTDSPPRFSFPYGICGDTKNLYVLDYLNATIRKVNPATGQVTTLAGRPGVFGFRDGVGTSARFGFLRGCWSNGTHLWVSDASARVTRRVEISTGLVETIRLPFSTTPFPSTLSLGFDTPEGIWGDGNTLYVADSGHYQIRTITAGALPVLGGPGSVSFAGRQGVRGTADGAATDALFFIRKMFGVMKPTSMSWMVIRFEKSIWPRGVSQQLPDRPK